MPVPSEPWIFYWEKRDWGVRALSGEHWAGCSMTEMCQMLTESLRR